jgi:hypothetical protein
MAQKKDPVKELGILLGDIITTAIDVGAEIEKRKAVDRKDTPEAIKYAVIQQVNTYAREELDRRYKTRKR